MLQDGRINGVKIGQQWRFPLSEVERLTGAKKNSPEPIQPKPDSGFPTHCVQTIQDLLTEVGGTSALVIDADGAPLTEISHPCQFCQAMLQSLNSQAACRASWKEFAQQSAAGSRFFTCQAGIQYLSAPILDADKPIAYFLAGEFYWQSPDTQTEADRFHRMSAAYNLPEESLAQAVNSIPVIALAKGAACETILDGETGVLFGEQNAASLIEAVRRFE